MVMKGDFDFEAEENGLSFGLGNDEEDEEDEAADSWQVANTAISIMSVNTALTSHTKGLHPKSSCTTTDKTIKEWYIFGNVKLAEAIVPEPCKPCLQFN